MTGPGDGAAAPGQAPDDAPVGPGVGAAVKIWIPGTMGVIGEGIVRRRTGPTRIRVEVTRGAHVGRTYTIQTRPGIVSDRYGGIVEARLHTGARVTLGYRIPPYGGKPEILCDTVLTIASIVGSRALVTDGTHEWHVPHADLTPV